MRISRDISLSARLERVLAGDKFDWCLAAPALMRRRRHLKFKFAFLNKFEEFIRSAAQVCIFKLKVIST